MLIILPGLKQTPALVTWAAVDENIEHKARAEFEAETTVSIGPGSEHVIRFSLDKKLL